MSCLFLSNMKSGDEFSPVMNMLSFGKYLTYISLSVFLFLLFPHTLSKILLLNDGSSSVDSLSLDKGRQCNESIEPGPTNTGERQKENQK